MSATTVTREDLYRLVWETPITRLAAGYGISGTGLKKICDRLDVPVPPRGYWARKEAGQPVVQLRLLKAKAGAPLSVVIHPTPPKEKPAPAPVLADNPRAGVKDGALAVPERLNKPHPVIATWIDVRRGEREASRHRPWGSGRATVPDFSDADHRRHRILNALFQALEADNHTVSEARHGGLEVKLGGKPVSFRLREKLKQIQRPLTDDEKRWGYHAKKGYRTETVGSGFLIFEIQSRLPGQLKSSWLETDTRRMEDKRNKDGSLAKSGSWAHNAEIRKLVNEAKQLDIGVAHEVSIPDFERRIGLPRGTGGKPFEAYLAIKQDEAVKAEVQALLARLKEPARYADVAAPECDAAAFVTDLLDQLRKRAEEHGWEDSFRLGE